MSRSVKKELLAILCFLLALVLFCSAAAGVLIPKRHDYGATWGMYEKEPGNSVDVMFFGSSLVYCDLIPSVMYEETGVVSYLMAGPDQRIPITYRYLREACRTQSPEVVFIEATALLLSGSSDSLKVNLAYMPWTENRLVPTFTEASEEDRPGLLFPLYAYHDRWDELHLEDITIGLFGYEADPLAGYTFLDRAAPMGEPYDRGYVISEDDVARNFDFARQIVEFCDEKGIRTVFFLAPTIHQPSQELQQRMERELTGFGAEFWNCNDYLDDPELDFSVDFLDPLHFNYRGAQKFSRYFARQLAQWGLAPAQKEDKALWQERIDAFDELRQEWDAKPVRYIGGASGADAEGGS